MLKRYTKYAHTDPMPQIPFDDEQAATSVSSLVFALSVICLMCLLFARATGVDLYRFLLIAWG